MYLIHCLYKNKADRLNEKILENTYNFRSFTRHSIKIKSRDGIVTLSGRVANKYEKDLASRTTLSVPNVHGVRNKLVIAKNNSAESDKEIAMYCQRRLATLSMANTRAIQIEARGGRVKLEGFVANLAAKNLVELFLRRMEGVDSVDNQLEPRVDGKEIATVRDKIDDVSLTGLITLGLLQDPMTASLSPSIVTSNGNVTIQGQAFTMRQIQKVSDIALLFVGVRAVCNGMTIRRETSR